MIGCLGRLGKMFMCKKPGGGVVYDNTPLLAGGSPRVWYAADRTGTTLTDGTAVDTWNDLSGNGFHLTGTATKRPLYKTSIVGTKPAILFDGSNDYMASSSLAFMNGQTDYTWFCVWKPGTQTGTFPRPWGAPYESGGPSIEITNNASRTFWSVYRDSGGTYRGTTPLGSYVNDTVAFHHYTKVGTALQVFKDGTSQASATSGDASNINGSVAFQMGSNGVGTTSLFIGHIAEVLVYNRALSAGEITTIKTYFATKYPALTIA